MLSSLLFFCLPPSRNSDPGSHSRLFSPLLRFVPCILSREDFSPFCPRRLTSNCACPRYEALSAADLFIVANTLKMTPRWVFEIQDQQHSRVTTRPPGRLFSRSPFQRVLQQLLDAFSSDHRVFLYTTYGIILHLVLVFVPSGRSL